MFAVLVAGGGVLAVGGGLKYVIGCAVGVLGCLSQSVKLWRREEVRAEMSGRVVVGVVSLKPKRKRVTGAKSSVSCIVLDSHVMICCFSMISRR